MIKICFVCLGNICRSPMAEYIMKDKINKLGLSNKFLITSRATSNEEEGNEMYPKAKKMLTDMNIPIDKHIARKLKKDEYLKYDYFICMSESNIKDVKNIFDDKDNKVIKLLDRDIADPWYTGDFYTTYYDLVEGIDKFIKIYCKNI